MSLAGYNVYVNDVLINDIPMPSIDVRGVASSSDYSVVVKSVDRAGLESVAYGPFTVRTKTYTPPPAEVPLPDADRAAVDAIVAAVMADNKVPGVWVSITGPRGYYKKPYGYSNLQTKKLLQLDDHFRMGSITKTVVATAILQQIRAGNLRLDDTLNLYVPDIPNGELITLEHLLTHRSGVFEYLKALGTTLVMNPTAAFSEDAALQILRENDPQFAPGSKWQYTNSNYVLLGAVLEAVSGRRVRDILLEDVIGPGMLSETTWPLDANIPPPASRGRGLKGFLALVGAKGDVTEFNPELAGASGALTTSIGDLTKWIGLLRDGTLLSPQMHSDWLETPYTFASTCPEGPKTLAYGFANMSWGESWLGHNGATPGFSDIAMFHRDNGASITVAENIQLKTNPMELMFTRIAELLYPGSTAQRNYTAVNPRPRPGELTLIGHRPTVRVDNPNQIITPTPGLLKLIGHRPGQVETVCTPTPGTLTLTGSQPVVSIAPVVAFREENLTRLEQPIPGGATQYRFRARAGGAGGPGGRRGGSGQVRAGGSGGGGGGYVDTGWQDIPAGAATYTCYRGSISLGGTTSTTSLPVKDGTPSDVGGAAQLTLSRSDHKSVTSITAIGGQPTPGGSTNAVQPGGVGGPVSAQNTSWSGDVPTTTDIPGVTKITGQNGAAWGETLPPAGPLQSPGGGSGGGYLADGTIVPATPGAASDSASATPVGADASDQPVGSIGAGGGGSTQGVNAAGAGNGGSPGGGGGGAGAISGTAGGGNPAGNGGAAETILEFR